VIGCGRAAPGAPAPDAFIASRAPARIRRWSMLGADCALVGDHSARRETAGDAARRLAWQVASGNEVDTDVAVPPARPLPQPRAPCPHPDRPLARQRKFSPLAVLDFSLMGTSASAVAPDVRRASSKAQRPDRAGRGLGLSGPCDRVSDRELLSKSVTRESRDFSLESLTVT